VVDNLEKGSSVEDSRVELKREWPDPQRAARRIAAHANAARGEEILWIIGVDERHGVQSVQHPDFADWWPRVQSCFQGPGPAVQHINISVSKGIVALLCFDTSQAPFVVKNPACGSQPGDGVAFEVPWRDGTTTRTATRNELLLILSPLILAPEVDVLGGTISAHNEAERAVVRVNLYFYVAPRSPKFLVVPFHRCSGRIEWASEAEQLRIWQVQRARRDSPGREYYERVESIKNAFRNIPAPQRVNVDVHQPMVEHTTDEIIFRGPGKALVIAEGRLPKSVMESPTEMRIQFALNEVVAPSTIGLRAVATPRASEGDRVNWKLTGAVN